MKRTDLKENSSVLFIGRGFIIAAIFITSSVSFTLGYFVGKSVRPPVINQTAAITPQNSTEQKNPVMYEKGVVNQQPEQIQEHQDQETQQTVEIPKTQETQQTQETQSSKETRETEKTKKTKKTKETKETPKPRKYTVQAGAFKNVSDANILKEKLDKKGHKTYIALSGTKNHKKLYKVLLGNFATRKEAEILAFKIKKSEGLNTFVTFKTEQEGLR
jgi:cell division septation protein DedD